MPPLQLFINKINFNARSSIINYIRSYVLIIQYYFNTSNIIFTITESRSDGKGTRSRSEKIDELFLPSARTGVASVQVQRVFLRERVHVCIVSHARRDEPERGGEM